MSEALYWIWLQEAVGIGNIKADKAVELFQSPKVVYELSRDQLTGSGLFTPKEADKIKNTTLKNAEINLELARKMGCQVITPRDSQYPRNLANIASRPCVLYTLGDISDLDDRLLITIVGARERKASDYGITAARKLSFDLAAAGCTVVSGLAKGVDTAAHEGALLAGGKTIGFCACGLDYRYPAGSDELKRKMLENGGALISEFPFGEQAHKYNFSIRNRLLSGISSGVVVAQASLTSGALITARYAFEQDRDVFAVPGDMFDPTMAGCNRLIKDRAKIVLNVYSILEEYINCFPPTIDKTQVVGKIKEANARLNRQPVDFAGRREGEPLPMVAQDNPGEKMIHRLSQEELDRQNISEIGKKIYRMLSYDPMDCDMISQRGGLEAMEVMSAMTELELVGLADVLPGKRYIIKERN